MLKQLFILTAFGIFISNAVFSQNSNRISVQTGLFNCFFDGSPIVNSLPIKGKGRIFGNRLIDSQGIELMHRFKKSQISVEYMKFYGVYNYTLNYGNAAAPAQEMWKNLKIISCYYNRFLSINEHWNFQYGAGISYSWGSGSFHHSAFDNGFWTESFNTGYYSEDIGLNLKAGIEYTPIKWLTIYSNFNFLGSVYQKNDIDFSQSYTESYHKNIPSKYSVSWRFGVGFNYGKIAVDTIVGKAKNRITIQTGLFHCFFDGTPMVNVNHRNKYEPFRKLLYSSFGGQFRRQLNTRNAVMLEYMYHTRSYWNVIPELKNGVTEIKYNTINATYERCLPLSQFCFTYGGGLNYRTGSESIVVDYLKLYNYVNQIYYEPVEKNRKLNDFGINMRAGIEYTPRKCLTVFSKVDLLGFLYMSDKNVRNVIQQDYEVKGYPRRFDLSWRFGIGFNF
ncbi:hypothetical protein [Fluviicola taffensis]|uniref:Uncharacterized protein n=1 Tax=Fluviicola taffensis (strain DSM 16823 / NCIMB 13979 / RW262) TaxID=755732 RepID=F2ID07_FLUTR|nr:hypothetical protein [Fluviicola taffensis]AEA44401.1 hypothetical protein Fluta_2415 [Fluviicola taffensis DSM 16823]